MAKLKKSKPPFKRGEIATISKYDWQRLAGTLVRVVSIRKNPFVWGGYEVDLELADAPSNRQYDLKGLSVEHIQKFKRSDLLPPPPSNTSPPKFKAPSCPHCGHSKKSDGWECPLETGYAWGHPFECSKCGKEYYIRVEVHITTMKEKP